MSNEGLCTSPKEKSRVETWVPRPERSLPPELFSLQSEFANGLSERLNIPLLEAISKYAPMLSDEVITYSKQEGMLVLRDGLDSPASVADAAYRRHLSYIRTGTLPYHEGKRFGCSSYEHYEQAISIHFENAEHDSIGPLKAEKLLLRRQEVADVMRDVHTRYPEATTVYGHSWLYNLESYRRIYPAFYTQNLTLDEDPKAWSEWTKLWGQFLTSEGVLHMERAQLLMERLKGMSRELPMSKLLQPPLMLPIRVSGPIQDFYTEYGIT